MHLLLHVRGLYGYISYLLKLLECFAKAREVENLRKASTTDREARTSAYSIVTEQLKAPVVLQHRFLQLLLGVGVVIRVEFLSLLSLGRTPPVLGPSHQVCELGLEREPCEDRRRRSRRRRWRRFKTGVTFACVLRWRPRAVHRPGWGRSSVVDTGYVCMSDIVRIGVHVGLKVLDIGLASAGDEGECVRPY